MKCVYLLQSTSRPGERYIGSTSNLRVRLAAHNAGQSPHTAKFRPWTVVAAIHFADATKAAEFERYLKTGSGFSFAKRHFW
ncbi:MAG: GIY-YIG nuclease family protein [candidate division WS1 bacterium]|nr:GIY-YIG nuclease family protein [candidate division WS1 bacterium]